MKKIEVKSQVRLGPAKIADICLNGIYFRLFRAMITLAIITLAVAFMANMLMGGLLGAAVRHGVHDRAQTARQYARWITRLSDRYSRGEMSELLHGRAPGDPHYDEVQIWGQLSSAEMDTLLHLSEQEQPYFRFFDSLTPGKRYILVGGRMGSDVLDWLESENHQALFFNRLRDQRTLRLPTSHEEFTEMLQTRKQSVHLWERVLDGHDAMLLKLESELGIDDPRDYLSNPPDDLKTSLAEAGFRWQQGELDEVLLQASQEQILLAVAQAIRPLLVRRDIAERMNIDLAMVNLDSVSRLVSTPGGIDFLFQRATAREANLNVPREQVLESTQKYLERQHLLAIEERTAAIGEGVMGIDRRALWLIIVACVVCVVGITNAMLMSVMERFREIATMKCLGATDGAVLALFILESCIQGLAGGILGVILGWLLSIALALWHYGGLAWEVLPVHNLFIASLVGIAIGVILAAVASIYPAWVASRLAPMEAMRVE